MKVVAIVGSPRRNGNTETLTSHCLKAIAEEDIDTELISLAGLDIKPCNHCKACATKEECSIQDDLFPIYQKMKAAHGIILASPVYFSAATSLIRALMERAGYMAIYNGRPFERKVGGPLVVARRAGQNFTVAELTLWFQYHNIIVPGSTYWNMAFGRDKGEVSRDEEGMRTAWNFGKNVAWLLNKING